MTVRLHIDRLVVDPGLGGDAHNLERDIGAALQVALATHQNWQAVVERRWQVDAPAGVSAVAPFGAGTAGSTLGARIGSAVHAAVTGSAGGPGGARR